MTTTIVTTVETLIASQDFPQNFFSDGAILSSILKSDLSDI